ncbi:MAG: hypothetical protein ACP5D7_21025 [Limnospira sp.]
MSARCYKGELEAIAPLLDQFRRSVLAAAFRGDLTAKGKTGKKTKRKPSKIAPKMEIENPTQLKIEGID